MDVQRFCVLAIDDNPADLELFRRMLERVPQWQVAFHGHETTSSALEWLQSSGTRPDAILLDYLLGPETGQEAILRLIEAEYEGPIIIMTGHGDEELAAELIRGGASDYIPKNALSTRVLERAISYSVTRHTLTVQVETQQRELLASYRELRRKGAEIQQMYHSLCHELRTPLTSMRQFLSLTLDGLAGPVTADQVEFLTLALESCDQMTVHVKDLVDVARIETGKLAVTPTEVDLAEMVCKLEPTLGSLAAAQGVHLACGATADCPPIRADETRLTQVMFNLVNNAVKFTGQGGSVTVTAGPDGDRPGWARVDVRDTGRGIPADSLEHIFDRLYQARETDWSTVGGLGLGLHLCREIVKLHGGVIRVESELGVGSTFWFSLPPGGPEAGVEETAVMRGASET